MIAEAALANSHQATHDLLHKATDNFKDLSFDPVLDDEHWEEEKE